MTFWFVYTWHTEPTSKREPDITTRYFTDKGKALRFAASRRKQGFPLVEVIRETGWSKTHTERHGMRKTGRKASVGRDADDPRPGEVFEAKTTGRRWRIVRVEGKNVVVEPAGGRGEDKLLWGRGNLKDMKFLKDLEKKAPPVVKTVEVELPPDRENPEGPPSGGFLSSIFGGGTPANENRDPRGRRKGKTRVQSLVFQKRVWNLASAKAWAKLHGYKTQKVDETRTQYRFRQAPPKGVVASKRFKPGLTAILSRKSRR